MLTELHIENIAVIEHADIEFPPGFVVLTGETGAGKSIVIDALEAVLGGRTSREIVRTGAIVGVGGAGIGVGVGFSVTIGNSVEGDNSACAPAVHPTTAMNAHNMHESKRYLFIICFINIPSHNLSHAVFIKK